MLTTVFQNSFLFMYKIIYLTILFKKILLNYAVIKTTNSYIHSNMKKPKTL